MPVPHHSIFYVPDALPDAQPTVSKHWRRYLKTVFGTSWIYPPVNIVEIPPSAYSTAADTSVCHPLIVQLLLNILEIPTVSLPVAYLSLRHIENSCISLLHTCRVQVNNYTNTIVTDQACAIIQQWDIHFGECWMAEDFFFSAVQDLPTAELSGLVSDGISVAFTLQHCNINVQ